MEDKTKEALQERAQLVRVHEANCGIEHPNERDLAFRYATQKRLAELFGFPKPEKKGAK